MDSKKILISHNFNEGLALLRLYLTFLVVNNHCFKWTKKNNKFIMLLKNPFHVPIFFIMSFYFFQKTLKNRNLAKFNIRFKRLLIPYIIWPILILIINNLLFFLFNINLHHSFKGLIKQLLTGHCFIPTLWFQINIIFTTFLFICIELIFRDNMLIILLSIEIASYFFQYSNYNYNFFFKFNFEFKYPFGRMLEIFPYTISGYILSNFSLIDYFKQNKIKSIYLCLLTFILFYNYSIINSPKGFGYSGLNLNILSICIFITFSLFNSKKQDTKIKYIIKLISSNSYGIYILHIPIMNYCKNYIFLIKKKTIYGSIIIFIICYLVCAIGKNIFRNTIFINLFS